MKEMEKELGCPGKSGITAAWKTAKFTRSPAHWQGAIHHRDSKGVHVSFPADLVVLEVTIGGLRVCRVR